MRASATAISKAIGVKETIIKRRDLLPLTVKALSEVSENVESYAIRRIKWVADCCKKENVKLCLEDLRRRAAVNSNVWKRPEVREAVVAVMRSFKESEETSVLKAN